MVDHKYYIKKYLTLEKVKVYIFEIEGIKIFGVSDKKVNLKRGTYLLSPENFEFSYHFNVKDSNCTTIYFGGLGECRESICVGYALFVDDDGCDVYYCLEAYHQIYKKIMEAYKRGDKFELEVL